jgi:CMP-N-acetylneuraminic acid synthetase
MIAGKRILAVVPARGGSKGVPLKNIRPVCGVPLVALSGKTVCAVPVIDHAVVSTDHEEIARVARESGLDAPFFRPESLSGDRIGDLEVLEHALLASEKHYGVTFDIVAMLQPTSPLRRPEHVAATLQKIVEEGLDAVWTVSPIDIKYHPLKQLVLQDGLLTLFDERGRSIIARQQLTPTYFRNGAAYAITRSCLLEQRTILGARSGAVVIDEPMVSIDTLEDFDTVERILKERS